MKPKRKPMFTTLFVCLMAYQAWIETSVPDLETVQITSCQEKNEQEKNKMTNIVPINGTSGREEKSDQITASRKNNVIKECSPFRDEEEPPPKPGLLCPGFLFLLEKSRHIE